ncbi:extracellular solute-binding protein [Cohnella thailandensis]|jgi:ABC-type sugar transport system, periplasmic component|uniref:Extracellular solute-binding protein n=1 Tax=Cohnella thailandensis TaxID=557557 RepID=A0A841SX00_9BACL|nr:extracellular solute-binding protein [Cohnella thailandensis]MBB6633271.1 extracellular solute-binding protein [Cohnella thailandensis]MBP1975031.1 raffinose/stachyose/melibiose transport system substrate-binding protein [Cohnella thailandensis]
MRKKTIALTAMALAATAALSACGDNSSNGNTAAPSGSSGSAASAEKVKLSIWHNFSGDDLRAKAVRAQIDKFKEAHPEIELDAQAIPPDGYRQRLKTVAAAGEMPDVFFTQSGTSIQEFYDGGLIQPITPLLDKYPEWKNNFMEGALDRLSFDGQVYATPLSGSATSLFFYNKSLFDKYQVKVPTTWEELMAAVKTFNDNGITPISLGNKAAWLAQSSILSSLADRVTGTDWFLKASSQDGAKFTDPEFVQALQLFKDLSDAKAFQTGANSLDNTQMEQYFIEGKAAMMIDGSWALTNMAATGTQEQLDQVEVTVLPSVPGGKGDPNSISGGAGGGLALSKEATGAKLDAALELIYAVSGPEGMQAIVNSNSVVNYNVEPDASIVTPLFYKAFDLFKSVKLTPVYDAYLTSAAADVINNGLQDLLLGGKPEDIAQKLQDAQAQALSQ